jgi:subtilisin family serine protease
MSACGGGGGTLPSPGTVTVPPPTPNTEPLSGTPYSNFAAQEADREDFDSRMASFETTEYSSLGALDLINASSAYARGATGAGVRVGVIDSGVYEEHFEFRAELDDKVDIVISDYGPANPRSNDAISHGTMVAGIIAANRDNASIRAYEIPLGSGDGPYTPVDESSIDFGTDNYFAERFTSMADQVDIINLSFGFSGVITSYSAASINSALSQAVKALRQKDISPGNRTIGQSDNQAIGQFMLSLQVMPLAI